MYTHTHYIHGEGHGWELSRTDEPGGLWSMGSQRIRHNLASKQQQHTYMHTYAYRYKYLYTRINTY